MPTVAELTALYGNFMLNPRLGPEVCRVCLNLTDGFARCYACAHGESWLDAVAPISYSVSGGQLHRALAGYKRLGGPVARRLSVELAAVLWRHLVEHEECIARAAGTDGFDVVATVPSGDRARDEQHPLRWIVSELVGPTCTRHVRLLRRSALDVTGRAFDKRKYAVGRRLASESVLLIDDTWTTGSNAQSAAAALRQAGAGPVAAVVIGRHLNRAWGANDRRLRALPRPFDWSACALHRQMIDGARPDRSARRRSRVGLRREQASFRAPPRSGRSPAADCGRPWMP